MTEIGSLMVYYGGNWAFAVSLSLFLSAPSPTWKASGSRELQESQELSRDSKPRHLGLIKQHSAATHISDGGMRHF